MIADRRVGLAMVGLGALLIGIAQAIAPLSQPPLYDGLFVNLPYVWLVPPAGAKGGAAGATGSTGLDGAKNRLIAVATPEVEPQAQLLATSGALVLPAGTTSIKFSIEPVLPQALPADGHIDGNVYRISVTNQAGAPLSAPASSLVTVVLRSPHSDTDRTMELETAQGWQRLDTQNQGPGTWLTVVTTFGDFAMVAPGASGSPYPTATPPAGPGASGAAPSPGEVPGGSSLPSASADLPSIGTVGGNPNPSPGPGAVEPAPNGGPPIILIGGLIVLALIGAGIALVARGRRKPPTGPTSAYRGAHRR